MDHIENTIPHCYISVVAMEYFFMKPLLRNGFSIAGAFTVNAWQQVYMPQYF
jgi:hypothetical protein